MALAGRMEVAAARGQQAEFARHVGVLQVVGWMVAAGNHLYRPAAVGLEFAEERVFFIAVNL